MKNKRHTKAKRANPGPKQAVQAVQADVSPPVDQSGQASSGQTPHFAKWVVVVSACGVLAVLLNGFLDRKPTVASIANVAGSAMAESRYRQAYVVDTSGKAVSNAIVRGDDGTTATISRDGGFFKYPAHWATFKIISMQDGAILKSCVTADLKEDAVIKIG